jgi:hypothetical protein
MITTQMGSTVNQKMAEVRGTLKLSLYKSSVPKHIQYAYHENTAVDSS